MLVFIPALALAQTPVRLIDQKAILGHVSIANAPHALTAMAAQGLDKAIIENASRYGDPANWPIGWRTDSARAANEHILLNAKAYNICSYELNQQPIAIVHIPAIENFHLPEQVRSSSDLYFMARAEGIGELSAPKPVASEGPSWRSMPKARIMAPAEVYATYDLSLDADAMVVLEKRGLSRPEIDAVIFRSHERNWPDGIDAFEKRRSKLKQFKNFKAYMAAQWGDKVLVVIPAEQNKDLPRSMRPYMDIYMVYT
ncbi:MAG: hypothetical protein M3R08_02215, partial [Bacteroidota bacterium]|nr:hypothetical protein [Bacteroidota bacterium]